MSVRWSDYYMDFAKLAATKAKHTTKVGAVLVGLEGEIRLTGFNGVPRGVEDTPDRTSGPDRHKWHSHAEQNIIAFAAREGIRTAGCTIYVTHFPCSSCARSLIQAGVSSVVYGNGQTSMPADEFSAALLMFREAGVELTSFEELEP